MPYLSFHEAYSYMNTQLFRGSLPPTILALQQRKGAYGCFSPPPAVEITLNPDHFDTRGESGVLSTLAHEMCHFADFLVTRRSLGHPRSWADRMIQIGLQPSDTGHPGGQETGFDMTHYIIPGGPFDLVCQQLITHGFRLSFATFLISTRPCKKNPLKPSS